MNLTGASLRRATAIAVIGLLCAVCALPATPASAATWNGTAHGKIVRSTRLVSARTSWDGNFWLNINRRGRVRGYAVVGYEPAGDVSGLNNAIGYAKAFVGATVGLLGKYAPFVSAVGLGQIVGVSVSFQEAMAVRRGKLRGELDGRTLSLDWAKKPTGIPYDISLQLVSARERISGGRAALRSPFSGAGRLVDRRDAVYSSEKRSTSGGVTEVVGSYWVAHRVR